MVMKRIAASIFKPSAAAVEADAASEVSPKPRQEHELAEEANTEETLRRKEEEVVAARRKELKAAPVDVLKQLVSSQGLDLGKKEEMVERMVEYEATGRAEVRVLQARTRQVLVDKKEALEAMPVPDLKERCAEEGVKGGQLTKAGRIEALLKIWMEDDGVNKALAKIAHDAREAVLLSMDSHALRKLSEKLGIDPFVREVMADRIVRREHAAGRFARPKLVMDVKEAPPATAAVAVDLVDALLASEAARKKDRELHRLREESAAKKRSDLMSKSVDEVKKLITSKGLKACGKKEDLVEALLEAGAQEEAEAKRKLELQAMDALELKKLLQTKALDVGSKKDDMVNAYLAYEAHVRKDAVTYSVNIDAALEEKRADLECKGVAELKQFCATRKLKPGANKEACLELLLEDLKANGEVDRLLARKARAARWEELVATATDALLGRCAALGICPLVREVMVERILAREVELGSAQEPAAKRPRTL